MEKLFKKILVANRGEIALRVIRSAHKLGIPVVAVYSDADQHSMHVRHADEAVALGGNDRMETYMNSQKVVDIALASGCDAIHPGYGFLSESPLLVAACERHGITFIGPHTRAITLMGNKIEARKFVEALEVPMTHGLTGDRNSLMANAGKLRFPVLVKAAAGGGGKGMRIVRDPAALGEVLETTSREAANYFGDSGVFIEEYIEEPRHIEVQLLGDNHGNLVHVYERECTIQRRYQKIIEESPSVTLTPEVREAIGKSAVTIGRAIGYNSVGTIEFLVDKDLNYYFLEMNTRIQVEHPVTELVTGIDLVEEQIRIAAGETLSISQENIKQHGHAIECRIYAEDPAHDFLPSPGKITMLHLPVGSDIRVDTSIDGPATIHSIYDPMISKLVVWAPDRDTAITNMKEALRMSVIHGIKTNISYLLEVLSHPAFIDNRISTKFCDAHTAELLSNKADQKQQVSKWIPLTAALLFSTEPVAAPVNIWEQLGLWRQPMRMAMRLDDQLTEAEVVSLGRSGVTWMTDHETITLDARRYEGRHWELKHDDHWYHVFVSEAPRKTMIVTMDGHEWTLTREDLLDMPEIYEGEEGGADAGSYYAPMPGKVIKVNVEAGQEVRRGTILLVVEAMKMENNLTATHDAVVEAVYVDEGDMVDTDKVLVKLHDND